MKNHWPLLKTLAHCLFRVGDVAPDVMVYLSRRRDCCGLIVTGVKRSCDPSKIDEPKLANLSKYKKVK